MIFKAVEMTDKARYDKRREADNAFVEAIENKTLAPGDVFDAHAVCRAARDAGISARRMQGAIDRTWELFLRHRTVDHVTEEGKEIRGERFAEFLEK